MILIKDLYCETRSVIQNAFIVETCVTLALKTRF